jgi:hypothetical protein
VPYNISTVDWFYKDMYLQSISSKTNEGFKVTKNVVRKSVIPIRNVPLVLNGVLKFCPYKLLLIRSELK